MKNKSFLWCCIWILISFGISFRVVFELKNIDVGTIGLESPKLFLAVLLFLISAFLRLKRTQIIIGFLKPNSLLGNLQGSSLGYLINLILPFRFGEIARAYFLSWKFGLSLGFAIGVIALDRGLDLVMISIGLVSHYGSSGWKSGSIFSAAELIIISTGALGFITLLAAILRAKYLLIVIQKISGLFNEKIRNRLRNSFWGLILVFQKLLQNRKILWKYFTYVSLSWLFTYTAVLILIASAQEIANLKMKIIGYIPFISFVILNGNNYYSSYSLNLEKLSSLISPSHSVDKFLDIFSSISWLILTFPYLIVGVSTIFFLLARKYLEMKLNFALKPNSQHVTKLSAPSNFLDSFFTKEKIIENIHKRSVAENFQVLEYFKGGSDAVTMLVQKSSTKLVHKVSGPRGLNQLKAQAEWLQNIKSESVVKVKNSISSEDFFELELEYIDNAASLFDYIHTNPLDTSKSAILSSLKILEVDVYRNMKLSDISIDLQEYLRTCFHERLNEVATESPDFKKFLHTRFPVQINGKQYFDLLTIFEKILNSEKCRLVLDRMNTTDRCHGDFTVDNILFRTTTSSPILIDPSDDNVLKGPLIDISRLMQSFLGGYEFLNQDNAQVEVKFGPDKIFIEYSDVKSYKYVELAHWLIDDVLPGKLSEAELKAVKFHVGIFYSRMITHRFLIDEKTMYKYVAVSIRYLNEFYEEVDCVK